MSTDNDEALIGRITRQGQIIVGALVTGVVFFLAIATVIDVRPAPPPQPRGAAGVPAGGPAAPPQDLSLRQILTWLAIGLAVIHLPLSFIVPGLITKQNRQAIATGKWTAPQTSLNSTDAMQSDTGKLAMVYLTQLIIGAAVNEGAAFFAGVAYLIGKDPIALGVGILLVGAIVSRFPTAHRVALWISRQEEMLFLERQAPA